MVRLKQSLRRRGGGGLAVGVDLRVPTGDALNLLGTGAAGVQPFAVWSATAGPLSPHVNISYRWNGNSVLAGDAAAGVSGDFPDSVAYAVGAEISAHARLTIAFDLIGGYTTSGERLRQEEFHALDGESVFPNIAFTKDAFNSLSGSIGAKTMIADRWLLTGNVLFGLDQHGVRDRVTPMLGLEYSF
jgi:hypothetical protein